MNSQDRDFGMTNDVFGDTSEERSFDAGSSVGPHDDDIDLAFVCVCENIIVGVPSTNGCGGFDISLFGLFHDGSRRLMASFFKRIQEII